MHGDACRRFAAAFAEVDERYRGNPLGPVLRDRDARQLAAELDGEMTSEDRAALELAWSEWHARAQDGNEERTLAAADAGQTIIPAEHWR